MAPGAPRAPGRPETKPGRAPVASCAGPRPNPKVIWAWRQVAPRAHPGRAPERDPAASPGCAPDPPRCAPAPPLQPLRGAARSPARFALRHHPRLRRSAPGPPGAPPLCAPRQLPGARPRSAPSAPRVRPNTAPASFPGRDRVLVLGRICLMFSGAPGTAPGSPRALPPIAPRLSPGVRPGTAPVRPGAPRRSARLRVLVTTSRARLDSGRSGGAARLASARSYLYQQTTPQNDAFACVAATTAALIVAPAASCRVSRCAQRNLHRLFGASCTYVRLLNLRLPGIMEKKVSLRCMPPKTPR